MRAVHYIVRNAKGTFHTENYMDATAEGNRILKVYLTDVDEKSGAEREYERARVAKLKAKRGW
jgi:hypothetical protein